VCYNLNVKLRCPKVNKTVVRANIEFSTKHDKWNARIQRWYNTGA